MSTIGPSFAARWWGAVRIKPMSPQAPRVIRYEFTRPGGAPVAFTVTLDPKTLLNLASAPAVAPEWAKLSFQKCPNCPLEDTGVSACPGALSLADVVNGFADVFSFDRVAVRVTTPERTYERLDMSVQSALSPLLGLLMVTSGCPILAKLRPQTRFHLPFATELETITRATSLYLLAQYFVAEKGGTPDWELEGLAQVYRATEVVNRAFANRLRAAAPKDANVNALIRLNTFAHAMPETIENHMQELRFLFE